VTVEGIGSSQAASACRGAAVGVPLGGGGGGSLFAIAFTPVFTHRSQIMQAMPAMSFLQALAGRSQNEQ
jgi:hypothetical protein